MTNGQNSDVSKIARRLARKAAKKSAPPPAPKSPLELLCEKHRIPVGPVPRPNPRTDSLPPLPENWKEKLSPAAQEHLKDRAKRIRVHLQRGIEAIVLWPAVYIEGDYLYYIGDTTPTQHARAVSRPGNFILEVVGGGPKHIVLRKNVGQDLNKYYFAYLPKGVRQIRTLGHHDWKACAQFSVLEDNVVGPS